METLRMRAWPGLVTTVALVAVLARPDAARAQTGTLTDDAYTSTNAALQLANASGTGPAIVVTGPAATLSGVRVGTATGYIRFRLTSNLPVNVTEADVARATLRLYVSFLPNASTVTLSRVTGPWAESTLAPATVLTLTLTPEVTGIAIARN